MGTVIKREGRVLNLNKDNNQKVLEISTDLPKKVSITKDDKNDFENFKVLYADMIKRDCLETYGTCDDEQLLYDTAKELFLKSINYVPNENDKVDSTLDNMDKKEESRGTKKLTKLGESSNNDFSSTKFENELPYQMRWKHWEKVGNNDLYWVTQEFFNEAMLIKFAVAFKDTGFDKAYVTTRDLSHYKFEKDLDNKVFVIVDADGNFDMKDYIDAVITQFPDYPKYYFENKNMKLESDELVENKQIKTENLDEEELNDLYNYLSEMKIAADNIYDTWVSVPSDTREKLDDMFDEKSVSFCIRWLTSALDDLIDYWEDTKKDLNETKEYSKQELEEASLSRLFQHTKNKDTFAVIGSQDKDTKKSRFQELKSLIGKLRDKVSNLGFNYLEGTYTYDDGEQGIEDSLIVYNIPKNDALDIANKLNQESIIWKDSNYFGFLSADGKEEGTFNTGNMTFDQQITNMYGSRLRTGNGLKPAFAFECKLIETDSNGSTFSKQHNANIVKYPVCNIRLDEELGKDEENKFSKLVNMLKKSNLLNAIDSVDITNYIMANDILTLNASLTEKQKNAGYMKAYNVYVNNEFVGVITYKDGEWLGMKLSNVKNLK